MANEAFGAGGKPLTYRVKSLVRRSKKGICNVAAKVH
jgi:hypothetical protein